MPKLITYWNTIKYLKLQQVVTRIARKFRAKKRYYYDRLPTTFRKINIAILELDCDERIAERFMPKSTDCERINLLNQRVKIDFQKEYTITLKPLIFNNVYYWEYGVILGAKYQKTKDVTFWKAFRELYENYLLANAEIKSPYIMSLHIPNILIALELFADVVDERFREKIYCELYSQYQYLIDHQEKHLLANHYFENLKALVIASYLFKDDHKLKIYLRELKQQCQEQILADGVHYELSIMYHKIILEDMMRIGMLAKSIDFPECEWVFDTIKKMTDACFSLEKEMGRTPLFNDAGDNVAKTCRQLCIAAEREFSIRPIQRDTFEYSGYYKLYDVNRALLFDAGPIGVSYQPAHGHCDCLSFELSTNGMPLFVNSGTYEYQGDKRAYFRRTCAHNTIQIGDSEQSECWGGFRVARRISHIKAFKSDNTLFGSYRNWKGELHSRELTLANGSLEVKDKTICKTNSEVHSYLHLAPKYRLSSKGEVFDTQGKQICTIIPKECEWSMIRDGELCSYAPEFGLLDQGVCIVFKWDADDKYHGYTISFN